jgi:hypothetical protein
MSFTIIEAFQQAPPPSRIGYRRQWKHYDQTTNTGPGWEYREQHQDPNTIMAMINSYVEEEGLEKEGMSTPTDLIWHGFFETWVPAPNQRGSKETEMYQKLLIKLGNNLPSLTIQVKAQLEDYRTFLFQSPETVVKTVT